MAKYIQSEAGCKMLRLVGIDFDGGSISNLKWAKHQVIAYDLSSIGHDTDQQQAKAVVLGNDDACYGPILLPDNSVMCTNGQWCQGEFFETFEDFESHIKIKLTNVARLWANNEPIYIGNPLGDGVLLGSDQINEFDFDQGEDCFEGFKEFVNLMRCEHA